MAEDNDAGWLHVRSTFSEQGWPMNELQGDRGMLVLSRKTSERILIGDDIAITIVRIGPNSVRIGIEAPKSMNIVREELCNFGSKPSGENKPVALPVS